MGKKSKTPEAPNYAGLAQQQSEMTNKNWQTQLQANRPNQISPTGSMTWEQDPTTGQWTQTVALTPEQQGIFNTQQVNQQTIGNLAGGLLGNYDASNIDLSQAPAMGQVGQFNQQATDLYNQLAAPQLQRQRAAKEAQMAAMGLGMGSGQAYNTQQELLNDAENRSAMMAAQAGIQQGNTMFGQQNQLHQQGVQDILNQKQANLAQLSGLMGLSQSAGMPNFGNFATAGNLTTPDMMGAAQQNYAAQMNAANAKSAGNSALLGTIGGIAGTFIGGPAGAAIGSGLGSAIGGGGGGSSSGSGGGLMGLSSGGSSVPMQTYNW